MHCSIGSAGACLQLLDWPADPPIHHVQVKAPRPDPRSNKLPRRHQNKFDIRSTSNTLIVCPTDTQPCRTGPRSGLNPSPAKSACNLQPGLPLTACHHKMPHVNHIHQHRHTLDTTAAHMMPHGNPASSQTIAHWQPRRMDPPANRLIAATAVAAPPPRFLISNSKHKTLDLVL